MTRAVTDPHNETAGRCKLLVWYELHATMPNAIVREKQIKGGSRKKKLALIETTNPTWRDLFDDLI
jgi:putative endonuclease